MAEGIFLQRGGELVDMQPAGFVTEDVLQALLEDHAVLLAGDQIVGSGAPRRFLLVRREAVIPDAPGATGRWSVDHLFIDQDAVPTLVEVKRSENTQIRREVVGQMLDYAANAVVHWPDGTLEDHFVATHGPDDGDVLEVLRAFLEIGDLPLEDATDRIRAWWQQAEANLRAGRLRLLFVADEIPPELRRIIEFLNEQMSSTEVLGVEVRNYVGGELRALVPRVIGMTEAARDRKTRAPKDSRSLGEIWATAPAEVSEARRLLDAWAAQHGIDSADLAKSRRYAWPGGSTIAYLYPGDEYRSLYLRLGALTDQAAAAGFQQTLSELRGGAKVAPKDPGVTCAFVVQRWKDLEDRVLTPLAEGLRPQ